ATERTDFSNDLGEVEALDGGFHACGVFIRDGCLTEVRFPAEPADVESRGGAGDFLRAGIGTTEAAAQLVPGNVPPGSVWGEGEEVGIVRAEHDEDGLGHVERDEPGQGAALLVLPRGCGSLAVEECI